MLIIVESPAKAKTISKIVGNKYTVKASVGHIRKISDKKKTKDGRELEINGIDIENDFTPLFEVDPAKKKQVSELKKYGKNPEEIFFATDSDREGEAISWHLSEILGIKDKSKIKRLEFHEITKKALEEAIKNPVSLRTNLVNAQRARQVLDKLVGYKLSPIIWKTMSNYRLSAGRVQSPALRLVCEREEEIRKFIPEEYWEISGLFQEEEANTKETWALTKEDHKKANKTLEQKDVFQMTRSKGQELKKITSRKQVETYTQEIGKHNVFLVAEVTTRQETQRTRPPFTTSTLQQAASSKLGYNPKLTMQLAQKLYEGVDINGEPTALITYMRTDSVNLSDEAVSRIRKYIANNYSKQLPSSTKKYKGKTRNAQEAHEAIRPTNPLLTPQQIQGKISPQLHKLYSLIWTQTIACQMIDEKRERVILNLQNDRKDEFRGSIAWTTEPGFKLVTGEEIKQKPVKELHKKGETLYLKDIFYFQKETAPPSRYSAASLIKKLEELGIGRPSTYASIISTLLDREYVKSEKNSLSPTSLGEKVNLLLTDNFEFVTSSELTANMENDLDEISKGEKKYTQVLGDFWDTFKNQVETKSNQIIGNKDRYKRTESGISCPKCGSKMDLRIGRFGEYYQCLEVREHQFPKNFREYEEANLKNQQEYDYLLEKKTCEECGKPLIVRTSRKTLKPYIACPDYKVGNKHTVISIKSLLKDKEPTKKP